MADTQLAQAINDARRILERAYDRVDAEETYVSRFDPVSAAKLLIIHALRRLQA